MDYFVELSTPIPNELVSDFLGKLYYISEHLADFTYDSGRVRFHVRPGAESHVELITSRIQEVAQKLVIGYRGYRTKILATDRPSSYRFCVNPREALIASGNLFEYGSGRFGIGPLLVDLEAYLEERILEIADRLNATRHRFPALVGVDVLQRCRYIQSFPHALSLVSHLREDLEGIQQFARNLSVKDGSLQYPAESVAAPKCLLAPTVCFHYYAWLQDRQIQSPQTITALGHCFRYESGNMTNLERLWDFTMREVVFVGPQEFVLQQRDQCIALTVEFLKQLELGFEIQSATDPFFIEGFSAQAAFQSAFELKFEIRADLPYSPGKSLAVGSFNFHQDFFGRSLSISDENAKSAFTGCVGYGMERLVWAFICQHGTDVAHWPDAVRRAMSRRVAN